MKGFSLRRCKANLPGLVLLLLSSCAAAQVVANKDLSATSLPTPTPTPGPPTGSTTSETCFISIACGAIKREIQESWKLEIVSVDNLFLFDGSTIDVTVRLTNLGDHAASIPWETGSVTPVQTDLEDSTTSVESAILQLTLESAEGGHRNYLKGSVNFEAAPNNLAQHQELLPGQSVEIKLRAAVECDDNSYISCEHFKANEPVRLGVHWWEWLFRSKGTTECDSEYYNYKSREIEAEPIEVFYFQNASPPQ
jgi:hypothetical protein